MESIRYLIYYTHLYTFFLIIFKLILSTPTFVYLNYFQKNDLHVLKLLKNVQSEPKLNSFQLLDNFLNYRIIFA